MGIELGLELGSNQPGSPPYPGTSGLLLAGATFDYLQLTDGASLLLLTA